MKIKLPPMFAPNAPAESTAPLHLPTCCWCDKPGAKTREHIVPLWVFRTLSGLVLDLPRPIKMSCSDCNTKKGAMPPAVFERLWVDTPKTAYDRQDLKTAINYWSDFSARAVRGALTKEEREMAAEAMRAPLVRAHLMVVDPPLNKNDPKCGPWLNSETYRHIRRRQYMTTHPTLGEVWPYKFDPYCGPWLSNHQWKIVQGWRERRDKRSMQRMRKKPDAFSRELDEIMMADDRPLYGGSHEAP